MGCVQVGTHVSLTHTRAMHRSSSSAFVLPPSACMRTRLPTGMDSFALCTDCYRRQLQQALSARAETCKAAERTSIVVSVRRLVLVRGRPARGVMLGWHKQREHMQNERAVDTESTSPSSLASLPFSTARSCYACDCLSLFFLPGTVVVYVRCGRPTSRAEYHDTVYGPDGFEGFIVGSALCPRRHRGQRHRLHRPSPPPP